MKAIHCVLLLSIMGCSSTADRLASLEERVAQNELVARKIDTLISILQSTNNSMNTLQDEQEDLGLAIGNLEDAEKAVLSRLDCSIEGMVMIAKLYDFDRKKLDGFRTLMSNAARDSAHDEPRRITRPEFNLAQYIEKCDKSLPSAGR